jgi:hypothetical protein
MLVNFNTIPDESRIWIYAAEHKLTNDQENYILNHVSDYLQNWEAHKVPLTAGVTILENLIHDSEYNFLDHLLIYALLHKSKF